MQLAQLLEKKDVIEDCRKKVAENFTISNPYRLGVEINLKGGQKRYFTCRNIDRKHATREALSVIKAIEDETGEKVLWRFKGEETYHMGTDKPIEYTSLMTKMKYACLEFFGLVE